MGDTISVIIPVYNVAAFLPQCLDSVIRQDYSDLEILVVDDGSTDGSGEICDEYRNRDSRIRVIHQENRGAGAAKNTGLEAATGTYLSFVDSDDFLEPDAYGYMVEALSSSGADLAQFSFRNVFRDHTEEQLLPPGRSVMDGVDYLVQFPKDWTCALLWNKLYRRQLYDGIRFPVGRKIDDEFFTYQALLKPCTVVRDDRIVYNYRKRLSSVMSCPESADRRLRDCLDAIVERREKVMAVYPQLRGVFDENYLDAMWYLSRNVGCTADTILLLKRHLKQYLRTPGNTVPPRYLWPMLWRLFWGDAQKMAHSCSQGTSPQDDSRFFE